MIIAKYNYRVWGGFWAPMIPVAVSRFQNRGFIQTFCLVDSGAYMSAMSSELAEVLGVKIKKGIPRSIRVAGGDMVAYEHKLFIKVKNKVVRIKVLFSDDLKVNIIGREDFFNKFLIIFRQNRKQLWLIGW